jgi:DNA-binding transcriptional ArsR family regulator
MSLKNPLGDFEVNDPRAMRALSHPVRLAILSRLQRHGPSTATQLAPYVGATPSVTSWHLRHLATFGLVSDAESPDNRQRYWRAVSRGFRFEMPDDEEGRAAGHLLRDTMHAQNLAQLVRWADQVQPRLDAVWDRIAGAANTRIDATPAEAEQILSGMEALLAPYVRRPDEELPEGARTVRFLRYAMPYPEGSDDSATRLDAGDTQQDMP